MTAEDFSFVRALLERHAGIVLDAGKDYLIDARLAGVARRHELASPRALVSRLRQAPHGPLRTQVVEALTTHETSFFRDVHPYEALRTTILPDLIERRKTSRRLTIWCAAASTGQEPYSVAILLREHFPRLAGWQVQIIASDLSGDALHRAREGRFNKLEAARGLEPRLRDRYFHEDGAGCRVRDEIRQMVEFRQINLISPWRALPEMDLILLRNVLIYLSVEARKDILKRVKRHLREDGYLMLGASETTLNLENSFEVMHLERTTCYRPGRPHAAAPRR